MKKFTCIADCTFEGRLFRAGEPMAWGGSTQDVPKHFRLNPGQKESVSKEPASDPGANRKEAILKALQQLDHGNDEHWNQNGSPGVKAVEAIMNDKSVTAKDIAEIAPELKRNAE
ncbi:hypothetical protein [Marinobacterium jannaschii]|uniref:hypothetical protein n=1 Tax=Marinobacterium jannaschii TaxID=64970 RepID=UPI0004848EDB|nr:hypothetical protein [Marinobacterium jannaschii]